MWYDLVCLVILGLSAWRGVVKGFVWQLASIAGILLCFVFAESFSLIAAPLTGLEPPLSRWVSILVLYILGSFGAFAFAKIVQAGLEKIKFQDYDRHLGAMFGLAKGACLCLVLSFFMFTLSPGTRDTVVLSNAGYASAVLFHQIDPVMPAGLHDILAPYVVGFDPDSIAQQRQHQVPIHTVSTPGEKQGQTGTTTGVAGNWDPQIRSMIEQLPGVFSSELQQILYTTLERTAPEDRPELLEKLGSGLPGIIRQVADQWKEGKPETATIPSQGTEWKQQRARLLKEIAGVYTEHLDAQQAIMEEVVYSLQGVPDAVTMAVLEDWHADLLGLPQDPDPTTKFTTSLDQRIANQLAKANISLNSLSADLRERLTSVTQRPH